MSEINKERFMSDIKNVLADAEDLLKQAAAATGERFGSRTGWLLRAPAGTMKAAPNAPSHPNHDDRTATARLVPRTFAPNPGFRFRHLRDPARTDRHRVAGREGTVDRRAVSRT